MGRSRAWLAFQASRAEIRDLLTVAEDQSDALPGGRRLAPQELLLRAAMVMIVAQLHIYLEELLEEWADLLGADIETLSPIGKRYVLVQARRSVEEALEEHSEADLGDPGTQAKLIDCLRESVGWLDNPQTLARVPNRRRVEGFFRRWGSVAIERTLDQFRDDDTRFFSWLRNQHRGYDAYFVRLNEAIQIRNEVAHGQIKSRLTLEDVRKHRATVALLIFKCETFVGPALAAARAAAQTP